MKDLDFEKGFNRLDEILEKMNAGKATLDESLALYEEADGLISRLTEKLSSATARVEMLIKKRNGELELNVEEKPQLKDFQVQE